jgi:TonB family protein
VPPRLVTFVEASYPELLSRQGLTGAVLLALDVDVQGRVTRAVALSADHDAFREPALAAARAFVFAPARVAERPVPVRITYRYVFTLDPAPVARPQGAELPADRTALTGEVIERTSERPVVGVVVVLTPRPGSTPGLVEGSPPPSLWAPVRLLTDQQGRFAAPALPPGRYRVTLSSPELLTVATEEELGAGTHVRARYRVELRRPPAVGRRPGLDDVDEEVIVRAPRLRREASQTVVRSEEARRVPGTQGDTLKVVQNLPGVARSAVGSGQLVVWGASPQDTRVQVDGVELPSLYHVGGLRSVVNSDLVSSIELLPGAFGADYGRALGGLVRVETKSLPAAGLHGYVAADVLDTSALLSAAIGARLRVAAAGRLSLVDRLLPGLLEPDVGDFFPLPRYRDGQLKATLALGRDEELSALVLTSSDELRRTVPSQDPAQLRSESTERSFWRVLLPYRRTLASGASVQVTPSFGVDRSRQATAFGAVPTDLRVDTQRVALRASYRQRIAGEASRPTTLTLGIDVQSSAAEVARSGSITLPPREGDVFVFGQPPGDDVNADTWSTHTVNAAPFATVELPLGAWTVSPGLRLDVTSLEVGRLTPRIGATPSVGGLRIDRSLEPRLALGRPLGPKVQLSAAAGLYHQAPEAEELSAVFGSPTLGPSRAVHGTVGLAWRLTPTLTAELAGFVRRLDQLVLRSSLPTPALAQALVHDGVGRSYGGQLLLRQELVRGLFGWVTYSLSRSERKHAGEARYRLFDYDQTHVLGLVLSYERGPWTGGLRFRYATGAPRTPVEGAFYDARGAQFQPRFGRINTIRVGDFAQLDLRLERKWVLPPTVVTAYVEVQNVTAHANPEELTYNYDFTRRGVITGLPTLAVVGARLSF